MAGREHQSLKIAQRYVGWRKGVQRRAYQSSSSCHYGGHAADCTTLSVLFLNFDDLALGSMVKRSVYVSKDKSY